MKNLKKSLFISLLLLGMVLLLAACGSSSTPEEPTKAPEPTAVPASEETSTEPEEAAPEPTEAPAPAEETVAEEPEPTEESAAAEAAPADDFEGELTLAIWGQIDADPAHSVYAYHEILQQWNEMHPNVDLKYELIGGTTVPDRFNWIATNMAAGTLPDVVMIYFPNDTYKDPDLVYNFNDALQQPNPYSDNATWWDDFPYDGLILDEYADAEGNHFFVGPTQKGDTGVTAIIYNKDIFDEVGVEPPETWAEFMDIQQKIKDAGYTPFFQPMAGPLGWLIGWPLMSTNEQLLDEIIKACDVEEPFDNISEKEMARCIKTGEFKANDPRHMETWQLMKDWSPYWQEGFLAPPPEGDPFAQGQVAMSHTMNLWIGRYLTNPDIAFDWGTFYLPPITEETTDLATGAQNRRVGNLGAPASGSQFLMIPQTTVENGKLDMALDLAQYTTAPEQLEYWCARQPIPCFEPGTPIEEVYAGQEALQQRLRGFFEPGSFENGVRGFDYATMGQDVNTQVLKLMQEYLGDGLTLEEAMDELQFVLEDAADQLIMEHPEWNADEWQ